MRSKPRVISDGGLIRVIEQGVRDGEFYKVDGRQTGPSLAALVVH